MSNFTRPDDLSACKSQGFVLVGVVVFVLALTILGISLFSLSGFEAQFLGRSERHTQLLNDAMSGVEWGRAILAREHRLDAVWSNQPAAATLNLNVEVHAWQAFRDTGRIQFGANEPVTIRSVARGDDGSGRAVEMKFIPTPPDSLYRNVVDAYRFFDVASGPPPGSRITELTGPVRVNTYDGSDSWNFAAGNHWYAGGGVPDPNPLVDAFITPERWQDAVEVPRSVIPTSAGPQTWFLLNAGSSNAIGVFKSEDIDDNGCSIFDQSWNPIVRVTGTCVWMVKRGMRFDRPVTVIGDAGGQDRLIIVAEPFLVDPVNGTPMANPIGIWCFSGLSTQPTDLPVFLVSSAGVSLERGDQVFADTRAEAISIFADWVFMRGPLSVNNVEKQVVKHLDNMDRVVDELAAKGVLPSVSSLSAAFTFIPGTWRELDPDNPN